MAVWAQRDRDVIANSKPLKTLKSYKKKQQQTSVFWQAHSLPLMSRSVCETTSKNINFVQEWESLRLGQIDWVLLLKKKISKTLTIYLLRQQQISHQESHKASTGPTRMALLVVKFSKVSIPQSQDPCCQFCQYNTFPQLLKVQSITEQSLSLKEMRPSVSLPLWKPSRSCRMSGGIIRGDKEPQSCKVKRREVATFS